MSSTVLVINSGSSSLKFQLVEPVAGMSRAAGIVERIGERSSPVADHAQALHRAFKMLAEDGIDLQTCGLVAVGHRVVHGGTEFHQPTLLDDTVIGKLEELSALAPLHNPPAVLGIKVARRLLATSDDSPIAVLVVPTNEELAIARDCLRVLGGRRA